MSQVHYYFRKSEKFYSIEELFTEIQKQLKKKGIDTSSVFATQTSSGIMNRLHIIRYAIKNQGKINHITGDIHFLGIFLPVKNTVLTIHDCGELKKLKGIKKFILWFFWFFWPVKRLRYITTVSQETKNELLKYVKVDPDKIKVIHNCLIGNNEFHNRKFDSGNPRVLQIGFTKNKNLHRIILALSGIKCILVILGTPDETDITELENSNIKYELYNNLTRKQVQDLYNSCDILLFPSLLEGFGLPIIEAQVSGIPVLTSIISSMPEVAGEGACLVNPYDIMEIRSGIVKIIEDETYRRDLIEKGFKNCKRFSPEVIANQYIELYKNITAFV